MLLTDLVIMTMFLINLGGEVNEKNRSNQHKGRCPADIGLQCCNLKIMHVDHLVCGVGRARCILFSFTFMIAQCWFGDS